jgi:acyl dehydratase
MRVFASLDELAAAVGESLGPGPWFTVTQDRIDAFAGATDDHQWIHVDPARAAAGPYGTTIAHGYLSLSLLPTLSHALYRVDGVGMTINYGLNRVRFPAALPSGSRVRASLHLDRTDPVPGGLQLAATVTVHPEHGPKPCCVAETLTRFMAAAPAA